MDSLHIGHENLDLANHLYIHGLHNLSSVSVCRLSIWSSLSFVLIYIYYLN